MWQLRVIATGEVVGTYVRRESVEDARHHAQRQPSEYEIIELFPEPTGDQSYCGCLDGYTCPQCLNSAKKLRGAVRAARTQYESEPKAPTGDEDWRTIVEAYPDARLWEHTPGDWQIAAGDSGEIKTYGHKTAEAAIATVARRIRAMEDIAIDSEDS